MWKYTFMKIKLMLVCALILSGCASPKAIDFSETPAPKPTQLVVSSTEKIGAQINLGGNAAANQFGLLGALTAASINAIRQRNANNDVVQINEHLQPFDIKAELLSQLEVYLGQSNYFSDAQIKYVEAEDSTSSQKIAPDTSKINVSYFLTDNFCCLNISLKYAVNGVEDKIVNREYIYITNMGDGAMDLNKRDDNIKAILNNDKAALSTIIQDGIKELITVMDRDLNGQLPLLQDGNGRGLTVLDLENSRNIKISRIIMPNGSALIQVTPI